MKQLKLQGCFCYPLFKRGTYFGPLPLTSGKGLIFLEASFVDYQNCAENSRSISKLPVVKEGFLEMKSLVMPLGATFWSELCLTVGQRVILPSRYPYSLKFRDLFKLWKPDRHDILQKRHFCSYFIVHVDDPHWVQWSVCHQKSDWPSERAPASQLGGREGQNSGRPMLKT